MGRVVSSRRLLYVLAILVGLALALSLGVEDGGEGEKIPIDEPDGSGEFERLPEPGLVPRPQIGASADADSARTLLLQIDVGVSSGPALIPRVAIEADGVLREVDLRRRDVPNLFELRLGVSGTATAVTLAVAAPGYRPARVTIPPTYLDSDEPYPVSLEEYARVLHGVVRDVHGDPVPNVTVWARSTDCGTRLGPGVEFSDGLTHSVTRSDGTFDIHTTTHHVALRVRDDRWVDLERANGMIRSSNFAQYRLTWGKIVREDEQHVTLVVVPTTHIAMLFRDEQGRPVQSTIKITCVDPRFVLSDVGPPGARDSAVDKVGGSSADGRFRCVVSPKLGVRADVGVRLTVYIEAAGYLPKAVRLTVRRGWIGAMMADVVVLSPINPSERTKLRVSVIRAPSSVRLLPRARTLEMRMRKPGGPLSVLSGLQVTNDAPEQGIWVFDDVPVGDYELSFDDGLGVTAWRLVELWREGRELEIRMRPLTGVRIEALSADDGRALEEFDLSIEADGGTRDVTFWSKGSDVPVRRRAQMSGVTLTLERAGEVVPEEGGALQYLYPLEPGAHSLLLRVPGFVPKRVALSLDEGELRIVRIELERLGSRR